MKDFVPFQILKIKGIKSNNIYTFDNSKRSRDFYSCIQVLSVNLTLWHLNKVNSFFLGAPGKRLHWIMLRCNSRTLGHRRSIFQVQFYSFPETICGVCQLSQVTQTSRSDIQKGTTTERLLQWTCGIIMQSPLPSYANLQYI